MCPSDWVLRPYTLYFNLLFQIALCNWIIFHFMKWILVVGKKKLSIIEFSLGQNLVDSDLSHEFEKKINYLEINALNHDHNCWWYEKDYVGCSFLSTFGASWSFAAPMTDDAALFSRFLIMAPPRGGGGSENSSLMLPNPLKQAEALVPLPSNTNSSPHTMFQCILEKD